MVVPTQDFEWMPVNDAEGRCSNVHHTRSLLAWLGVLHDDELVDLLQELQGRGYQSSESLMKMYNRLNQLDAAAAVKYVSLVESPKLEMDIVRVIEYLSKRRSFLNM